MNRYFVLSAGLVNTKSRTLISKKIVWLWQRCVEGSLITAELETITEEVVEIYDTLVTKKSQSIQEK